MKSVKKNVLASSILSTVTLLGAQFAFTGQAHAWVHRDARFNVCNDFNWPLTVFKTHSYQMDVNNDHSANQTIQPHTCAAIDFWALFQDNGWDVDDAMDFQVNDGNGKAGEFTIYNSPVLDQFTFKLRNNSGFVFLSYPAVSNGFKLEQGEIRFH